MNDLEDRVVAFAARCIKVCAALTVKGTGLESAINFTIE